MIDVVDSSRWEPRPAPAPEQGERSVTSMFGRRALVERLCSGALSGFPPLTLLTGEAGSGRSAVLDAVAGELVAAGARVVSIRVGEHERSTPYGVLYRLLTAVEELGGREREPTSTRDSVLGLVARLSADTGRAGDVSDRLANTVLSSVRRYAPLTVLIDDAQWTDAATASLLDRLTRLFAGQGCSIVATWRIGHSTGQDGQRRAAEPARLEADGFARFVPLRPLTRAQSAAFLADSVRAVPDAELVDRLHTASRGNPAALRSMIEVHRQAGVLRVVDQHAYTRPAVEWPSLSESHPLLAPIHETGSVRWSVARAMAVLAPLDENAVGLAAEALDLDPETVRAALDSLVTDRVLVGSRGARQRWRFRIPAVRDALESSLGPYERRRLCALAATAVRDGTAEPDDENYLPDRLADAGKLVDSRRSAELLLTRGVEVMFTDGLHAVRWLRAVLDRASDPEQRAVAVLTYSAACAIHGRMTEAADGARATLLEHADRLPVEMLQEVAIVYVTGLAACERWSELYRLGEGEPPPVPGGPANELVTRAFALIVQGRWAEGDRLLAENQRLWSAANPITADFGHMFRGGAGVLLGDPSTLRRSLADPGIWSASEYPQHRFEQARYEVDMLLQLGELDEAMRVLDDRELALEQLQTPDQSLVLLLRGEHSKGLDAARRSIADGVYSARPLAPVRMAHGAAGVLTGRGWLSRARQLIGMVRGRHLGHVLDHAESWALYALGEESEADELLRSGLRSADEQGFVLGTDWMWADLAVREHRRGDTGAAEECVCRGGSVAEALGTGRSEIAWLLSRALVHGDRDSGRAAVRLARERAMPDEMAWTFLRAARSGVDTARLLPEAYELFGELDALLWRARTRGIMREHDISVPGRGVVTTENERLLAVLVTEGLGNRQLATVLGTSEKSVEGRLTRMFARTGHRSRVELAAAMLTGEYTP
ncbi:regulatory protein, luxR family [Actinopolyspora lacussalsi subsp. righensis]|uniref:Regulatory protein, luxR family n=1 Tax=Actinopolyspora righensis TaxID=995060 RepID=A0A1I6XAU8_9ACTN|nr:LuxR family transcriptional regulator [Actinopolyspora righensis]SFT35435.1 regulatory protein, luxR family [Actinopolyspora righensis]